MVLPFSYLSCILFSSIVSIISVLAELGASGHVEILSPNTAQASGIEVEGRPVAR